MISVIQQKLMRTDNDTLLSNIEKDKYTSKMLKEILDRIKDWYKYQPHFPQIELDDQYLMRHLVTAKFDAEKLKPRIDALLTARAVMPQFFGNRDPLSDTVSKALDSLDLVIMPSLTEENYRVMVMKFNIDSLEEYTLHMPLLCAFMLADVRLYTDTSAGDLYVCDFSNVTANHIKQVHLPSLKNLPFLMQKCYGASIKGIHIINAPVVAEFAISIVKAGLSKKVAERLVVHSTKESFEQAFPVKYLPKDMGGEEPLTLKETSIEWGKALKTPEMRQWFLDLDDIMKSDEAKRLEKHDFFFDDIAGARGTFRQLELD